MDDLMLPTDMQEAQHFLIELSKKDQDLTCCRYPTCRQPRRPAPEGGGNIPVYCDDQSHTAQANSRLRGAMKRLAKGLNAPKLQGDQPITSQTLQRREESILVHMKRWSSELGLYITELEEIGDVEVASARIETARYQALAQIAAAQETAETERSLRVSAENSRDAAHRDAQAARNEAALALTALQESEERARREREAHERQVTDLQREHESVLEMLRTQTQQRMEAVEAAAAQTIAQAQEQVASARQEANAANILAHDAEIRASVEIASAQQRVTEASLMLTREQQEVQRLRVERDAQAEEARKQAQAYRTELQQLRADLVTATSDARTRAEDDRKEIVRLRENLHHSTQRADELARAADIVRTELYSLQTAGQKKPEKG